MDAKPGIKTSEFWVSLVTALAGVAVALGFLSPAQAQGLGAAAAQIAGGVVAAAAVLGYNLSRGKVKAKQ